MADLVISDAVLWAYRRGLTERFDEDRSVEEYQDNDGGVYQKAGLSAAFAAWLREAVEEKTADDLNDLFVAMKVAFPAGADADRAALLAFFGLSPEETPK